MVAKKLKPAESDEPSYIFEGEEGVCITKGQLEEVLRENMLRKTGSLPIEGQLDDLWRHLREM